MKLLRAQTKKFSSSASHHEIVVAAAVGDVPHDPSLHDALHVLCIQNDNVRYKKTSLLDLPSADVCGRAIPSLGSGPASVGLAWHAPATATSTRASVRSCLYGGSEVRYQGLIDRGCVTGCLCIYGVHRLRENDLQMRRNEERGCATEVVYLMECLCVLRTCRYGTFLDLL